MKLRVLLASLLFCASVAAQTAPTVSLSIATGNIPTVTWICQATATACTASGSWTGAKANSGSQVVPAITDTATYVITATIAGKDYVDLSWVLPTKNTDGTALTDLAGIEVYSGTTAASLTLEKTLGPMVTSYRSTGLAPGVRMFALRAINSSNIRSAPTPTGSGTTTAAQTSSASVTLRVPSVATGFTVQ